jgi:predicted transcriptional regulator
VQGDDQLKLLLELAATGNNTKAELAEQLRVFRTTIYRELQRAGSSAAATLDCEPVVR